MHARRNSPRAHAWEFSASASFSASEKGWALVQIGCLQRTACSIFSMHWILIMNKLVINEPSRRSRHCCGSTHICELRFQCSRFHAKHLLDTRKRWFIYNIRKEFLHDFTKIVLSSLVFTCPHRSRSFSPALVTYKRYLQFCFTENEEIVTI